MALEVRVEFGLVVQGRSVVVVQVGVRVHRDAWPHHCLDGAQEGHEIPAPHEHGDLDDGEQNHNRWRAQHFTRHAPVDVVSRDKVADLDVLDDGDRDDQDDPDDGGNTDQCNETVATDGLEPLGRLKFLVLVLLGT